VVGGGTDMLPHYTPVYNNHAAVESPFEIDLMFALNDQGQVVLTANVTVTGDVNVDDQNKLIFMTTYNYSESYFCTVQRYAEHDFDLVNIDQTGSYIQTFDLDPSWDLDKINGIAIIQKMDGTSGNYPIHQAAIQPYPISVPNQIADKVMEVGRLEFDDLTDYFHYLGTAVNPTLAVNSSDNSVCTASIDGTSLYVRSTGSGVATITISAEHEGFTAVDIFTVSTYDLSQKKMIVLDIATDNNHGEDFRSALAESYTGEITLASSFGEIALESNVEALFILCGVYSNGGAVISPENGETVITFLNNGGSVYIEGGDTWGWDNTHGGYDFNSAFGIASAQDGSGSGAINNIDGVGILDGMNFSSYNGGTSYIDLLTPMNDNEKILINGGSTYGIAHDAGNYKSVAASIEVATLGGDTHSAADALAEILSFFEVGGEPLAMPENAAVSVTGTSAEFTWDIPSVNREVTGYKIYLDSLIVGETTELNYLFENLTAGSTYTAGVRAIYATGLESPTSEVEFTLSNVSNDNIVNYQNRLLGNYPNPFNPTTNISFSISKDGNAKIDIFNVRGQKIRTLGNKVFKAGVHKLTWNGEDESNKHVSSGIYFYKLQTDEFSQTCKMLLLK
jgi:hypothetical protein